jgi:hypothetical protein
VPALSAEASIFTTPFPLLLKEICLTVLPLLSIILSKALDEPAGMV